MCIAFWRWFDAPGDGAARFILAFNRDEYYDRLTRGFHIWDSQPNICAPRDMEPAAEAEQGSWIGANRRGLLALLTNYREAIPPATGAISRGALVRDFLLDTPATPGGHAITAQSNTQIVREYAERVFDERALYSGFNLVLFDLASAHGDAWYVTNRGDGGGAVRCLPRSCPAGLSNSTIDRPWAKVDRGLQAFTEATADGSCASKPAIDKVVQLMADTGPFSAARPPQQLADLEQCIFVPPLHGGIKGLRSGEYGTRTTHVLLLRGHELTIVEHNHDTPGATPKTIRFLLDIPSL
ncbi:Transport and Golgi organization protein 2 [Coemansia spiralis]|nr:Transport and Golgi organization protein 2 [Coemansia spiralis]